MCKLLSISEALPNVKTLHVKICSWLACLKPYSLLTDKCFTEPEKVFLLQAWWIRLQEPTAFRLSPSISTAQAAKNPDPGKALSRVVTLSDFIIIVLQCGDDCFCTQTAASAHREQSQLHLLTICNCAQWLFSAGILTCLVGMMKVSVLLVVCQSKLLHINKHY